MICIRFRIGNISSVVILRKSTPSNISFPSWASTRLSKANPIVETYREDQVRSDIYRVRHNVSETLFKSVESDGTTISNVSAACVYLFDNVTT